MLFNIVLRFEELQYAIKDARSSEGRRWWYWFMLAVLIGIIEVKLDDENRTKIHSWVCLKNLNAKSSLKKKKRGNQKRGSSQSVGYQENTWRTKPKWKLE